MLHCLQKEYVLAYVWFKPLLCILKVLHNADSKSNTETRGCVALPAERVCAGIYLVRSRCFVQHLCFKCEAASCCSLAQNKIRGHHVMLRLRGSRRGCGFFFVLSLPYIISLIRRMCTIVLHTVCSGGRCICAKSDETIGSVEWVPSRPMHTDVSSWTSVRTLFPWGWYQQEWFVCFSEQERNEDRDMTTRMVGSCVIHVWIPNALRLMAARQWSIARNTREMCVNIHFIPVDINGHVVLRVTNWYFRLNVCSIGFLVSINVSILDPAAGTVSTFTVRLVCTSEAKLHSALDTLHNGFRCCRYCITFCALYQSRCYVALLMPPVMPFIPWCYAQVWA